MLFERGIIVSYESMRRWCHTFGPAIAAEIRRRRPQPKGTWHLDEIYSKMNGKTFSLWHAVDTAGMVLAIVVQERRTQAAAAARLQCLVDSYPDQPRVAITDQLASFGPAIRQLLPETEHRKQKGLNNRAEHSPSRRDNGSERCADSSLQCKPSSF